MFALGSQHAIDGQAEHYLDIGKEITQTCHMSYDRTGEDLLYYVAMGMDY